MVGILIYVDIIVLKFIYNVFFIMSDIVVEILGIVEFYKMFYYKVVLV